jgi:hypothetical protein
MKNRPEIGKITGASAIAAVCGGAATAMLMVAGLSLSGDLAELIIPMLLAVFAGMIISLFTAWPLGVLVGWLTGSMMGMRPSAAAIAGVVTALIMFAAALGDELFRSGIGLTEAYSLGGFCVIGAVSGLLGYRATMGPLSKPAPSLD